MLIVSKKVGQSHGIESIIHFEVTDANFIKIPFNLLDITYCCIQIYIETYVYIEIYQFNRNDAAL